VSQEKQADVPGKRVYEYVSEDGTVFYSFTRTDTVVVPAQRLYLRSRLGTHLLNFVFNLRRKGEALARDPEGDEG
jgi:hypothetical protein